LIKKGNGKSNTVKASSNSEEFSSPAILASYSQFKSGKRKMDTVETNSSEHCFSNKMDLKLPVHQPVFKSILETNTLENISINQYRKFSNDSKTAHADVSMPSMERTSTYDETTTNNNSISITNTTSPSIIGSLVAEEGKTSRYLRPRHHMDNLSKYNSKNINI